MKKIHLYFFFNLFLATAIGSTSFQADFCPKYTQSVKGRTATGGSDSGGG